MSPISQDEFERWRPGDVIPIRHVQDGEVRFAEAVTVVEDLPERLVVFAPVGCAMQWNSIDWETGAFGGVKPQRRHTTDALKVIEPGAQCTISLFFAEGMERFICWYVDLEEPTRRAGGGLVTFDRSLDIVVGPDRRWRWKDEDHFAHIQRFGWITPERAAELRAEGERVLRRIEAVEPPFDDSWLNWRPDPAWPLPELPDDWATVP
jgi:hypothetical protein